MQPQNHNTIDDEVQEINEERTLIKAAKDQNVILVQSILKIGADVNVQDENGSTPLHIVSENGNAPIADLLLRFGAKVNIQNSKNETPIYFAVISRHFEVVEKLLANSADLNVEGEPLLHLAIDKKIGQPNLQIVKKLIDYGANIETQDQSGRSPLRLALLQRNDEIIKVLLLYGAKFSMIIFSLLALKGDPETVQIMLDHGAELKNFDGLPQIVVHGRLDVLRVLIRHGVDLNRYTLFGNVPLNFAIGRNLMKIIFELLKNGANPNLPDRRNGNTPVHYATKFPCDLEVFLNSGVFLGLNMRNDNGETVLELALTRGRKDTAKMIFHYNHN